MTLAKPSLFSITTLNQPKRSLFWRFGNILEVKLIMWKDRSSLYALIAFKWEMSKERKAHEKATIKQDLLPSIWENVKILVFFEKEMRCWKGLERSIDKKDVWDPLLRYEKEKAGFPWGSDFLSLLSVLSYKKF